MGKIMKKSYRLLSIVFVFSFISAIFLSGCRTTCEQTRVYIKLIPIYESLNDIRSSFLVKEPVALEKPGKIYVLNDLLFIVDKGKGFHIVDNTNINAPKFLKFVQMHACSDITSLNGNLYVSQGPDIVTLNITDINNITVQNRLIKVAFEDQIKADSFVVDQIEKEVVEVIQDADCGSSSWGFGMREELDFMASENGTSSTGLTGSMARLNVVEDYLYLVDNNSILTFSLSNPNKPVFNVKQSFGAGIETIYNQGDYLFIGTTTGMLIFEHNNGNPKFVSNFNHARGCDPVVVKDNLAYVTLRGNDRCGAAPSELNILDITNIKNPVLVENYSMNDPHGLGIRNGVLAICDGASGLRLFDVTKTNSLLQNEFATETGMKTYDVIMLDNHIILSSDEGIFQYDISNPSKPIRTSSLFSK